MPSQNKTPHLSLNDWEGTDTPLRADFNRDNALLDAAVGGHLADRGAHFSPEERARFDAPFAAGSYEGDSQEERRIALGFRPRYGVVYSVTAYLMEYYGALHVTNHGMGFVSAGGCSLGLGLTDDGFSVMSFEGNAAAPSLPVLNKAGVTYAYLMWR